MKILDQLFSTIQKVATKIYWLLVRRIRDFFTLCGNHPLVTGVFSVLGILGIVLSIISYKLDRQEAIETTDQVGSISEQIKELESKIEPDSEVFLYEEKVEIYWNDWSGFPLRSKFEIKKYGQANLTIRGEGKTVDFTGTLSMNCKNGRSFWVNASNFGEPLLSEKEIDELVPKQVIRNVYKLYCKEK